MFAPTRAFPPVSVSNLPAGPLSYFFHWLNAQIFWHGSNFGFRRLRKADPQTFDLELHWPFSKDGDQLSTPLVLAYSPTVVPRPDDWSASHIYIPGYLFLEAPATFRPPAAITDFLSAGDPPVCVNFGSMIHRDAEQIHRAVLEALHKTGNRAVVLSGWGTLYREHSADILVEEDIPHDWLLPRCKALIHHGGAGTTAAGLRCGIPNIVVPFAADQPFWGARVHTIGAGPQPIPVRAVTAEKLVAALLEAEGDAIRNGAQAAGRKIRTEDGVGMAVKIIEEYCLNR
jgi:UDP:flavonoid glycosyltransferase YjiC (YdhE family)